MQTIHLHIHKKTDVPVLYAKQKDVGRKFKAVISDGTDDYQIPQDTALSVWYSGTSGEGNYSTIGPEKSAFLVEGNTITVELIAQMLTNKGGGMLSLVMHSGTGVQIGLWNIHYIVEELPGADSTAAEQYYNAFSETVSQAVDAAKRAEIAADTLKVDTTLSTAGRAADAAAVGTALAGKAPSGYGLGGDFYNMPVAADANSCVKNGWYKLWTNTANGIGAPAMMRVDAEDSEYNTVQTTYSGSYTGAGTVVMQRVQFQGTWGEWEWVNPHMIPGSEYRTTERWNGKVVYTQLINCGNMPNSQTKAVTTTIPVSAEIVSQKANATDGTFTSSYLSANIYMGKGANNWIVYVESTGDDSASTLYLTVKYTKQ